MTVCERIVKESMTFCQSPDWLAHRDLKYKTRNVSDWRSTAGACEGRPRVKTMSKLSVNGSATRVY